MSMNRAVRRRSSRLTYVCLYTLVHIHAYKSPFIKRQDLFQSSPSPKGRERKKPPLRPKRSESPTKVEESRVRNTLFLSLSHTNLSITHTTTHTQLLDTSRGLMRLSGSGRRSFNAQLRSMESSVRLISKPLNTNQPHNTKTTTVEDRFMGQTVQYSVHGQTKQIGKVQEENERIDRSIR